MAERAQLLHRKRRLERIFGERVARDMGLTDEAYLPRVLAFAQQSRRYQMNIAALTGRNGRRTIRHPAIS